MTLTGDHRWLRKGAEHAGRLYIHRVLRNVRLVSQSRHFSTKTLNDGQLVFQGLQSG